MTLAAAAIFAPGATRGTPGVAAASGSATGIRPLLDNPIAPRGGVMMVPLAPERPSRGWPSTATLSLADGRTVPAALGWIHPAPNRGAAPKASWTDDPRRLRVRAIAPTDGEGGIGAAGTPILLAHLPDDGGGAITLGGHTLHPVWCDLTPLRGERLVHGSRAADRPDPDSPFEYWRWALLAERLDAAPPHPGAFTEVEALLAQHYADLWRVGLARLASQSEGVAAHVRDLLTRICVDGDTSFAAWIADPVATGDLLITLLNFRRSGESITAEALDWADRREKLTGWIEDANADRVRLAVVNPSFNAVVARLSWSHTLAEAGLTGISDIPLAVELDAGRLTRITIDRPAAPPGSQGREFATEGGQPHGGEEFSEVLRLEWPEGALRFAPGPRTRPVMPPGLSFPDFAPPMTLAALHGAADTPISTTRGATVHIRRLHGRWELFFECRRPRGESEMTTGDSITIFIGPDDDGGGPDIVLRVPETGWHELLHGGSKTGDGGGTLQVHRRSYEDRWYARIALPSAWLNLAPGEFTLFGFTRVLSSGSDGANRFGDDSAVTTHTPGPALPWRNSPGRAAVDLSRWDDLPMPALDFNP